MVRTTTNVGCATGPVTGMCAIWQTGQADAAFGSSWCHNPPAARKHTSAAKAATSITRRPIPRTDPRGAPCLNELSPCVIEFARTRAASQVDGEPRFYTRWRRAPRGCASGVRCVTGPSRPIGAARVRPVPGTARRAAEPRHLALRGPAAALRVRPQLPAPLAPPRAPNLPCQ